MKKQILGISLFIAIVGVSVFVYGYFNYSETPDCASTGNENCARATFDPYRNIYDGYDPHEVEVKLQYTVASVKNEQVKARLMLDWQGTAMPPKTVWVQLQFHNYDGSSAGWVSEPVKLDQPFEKGWITQAEPVFECNRCASLPRNLYATARVWSKANSGQNLLYEVNNMQPVIVQE